MKADFKDALMLRLEPTLSARPGPYLFLNAQTLPAIDPSIRDRFLCVQESRSEYRKLENAGYEVVPHLGDETPYSGAVVLVDRSRRINEKNIILANASCEANASILIAGDKKSGISALRKWSNAHFDDIRSFSKYHAVVLEFSARPSDLELPSLIQETQGFETAEGMFSAGEIDPGSALLAECFDDRIRGNVADLGAGWGYLSVELAKKANRLQRIDLFENHFSSTEAAKKNLEKFHSGKNAFMVYWRDVLSEPPDAAYDWVIMNPPFHSGRAAEPGLGLRFIEVARKCLKQGGRLLMVANRNLPYEAKLSEQFRTVTKLLDQDGYKVFEARR